MSEDTTSHGKRAGFDRRHVLKGFAGAAAVASLSGKAFAQTATKESPDLAKAVADGKLPTLADRVSARIRWSSRSTRSARMAARCVAACAARPTITASCAWSATRVSCAGTWRSPEVLPNVAEKWDGQRQFHRIHLPPAQGHEVVGRQALHGRRRRLLDRGLRQELRALQVRPVAAGHRRQARHGRPRSTTPTVKFTFAGPYALFLEQMATPLGPAPDAVRQALLQPVPSEVQPDMSPTW